MSKSIFYIVLISFLLTLNAFAQNDNIELLTKWFSGEYSTTEQSVVDSQIIDIHLQVTPFSLKDKSGNWFYMETAFSQDISSPYRQEVYHIFPGQLTFLNIDKYSLVNPDSYIGSFRNDSLLNFITIKELLKKDNCTVFIKKSEDIFIGASSGKGCKSKIRGSNYSTTDIEITEVDFFLWERGYDLRNKQVWGPSENGYIFKKITVEK